MIGPLLKPRYGIPIPRPRPNPKRLPKRKPMTIAIGMLCEGGLIVAADTQLTWNDGRTDYGPKVHDLSTDTATYVLAYSADNAEAAETLLSEVKRSLSKPIRSLSAVENSIKEMMKKWNSAFSHSEDRPEISFLVGAQIKCPAEGDNDTLGLFLCELPFTVSRKTIENSRGYIARGCGHVVTDALFRVLFQGCVSPHAALCRVSYLMYRAKIDFRGGCGGDTDAIFLRKEDGKLIEIKRLDMRQAESFGEWMDGTLAKMASFVMPENYIENPQPVLDFAADVMQKGLAFRRLRFRSKTAENIEPL